MTRIASEPVIYELDTWVWLDDLSRRFRRRVTLEDVPDEVWDHVALPGVDAVWLMGVWQRSAAGRQVALENESFRTSFDEALPGYSENDVVGSPYCVGDYEVDDRLGGTTGLQEARSQLARRGIGLILDYVPNHVAYDHPWVTSHPEFFLQPAGDYDPALFAEVGGRQLALGRDPFFPPWPDVIQLNAFSPALRSATARTLLSIGDVCDGVRCDMAMLFVNDVFERTWGDLAGPPPGTQFWVDVISSVKRRHNGMTFIAEAYWDMEGELIAQGFDFAYDKRLYDRLVHDNAESVRAHLGADVSYQRHMLRFLENHDEPRAAATFAPDRERAAAVVTAFTPGATMYHEGQLEGRRIHNPVPLGRRVDEVPDVDRVSQYTQLMEAASLHRPLNDWRLCDVSGWSDNPTTSNLVAWTWESDAARYVAVVNLSPAPSQGRVHLPWTDLSHTTWAFVDVLDDAEFKRQGSELAEAGLYVDLGGWQHHVLQIA